MVCGALKMSVLNEMSHVACEMSHVTVTYAQVPLMVCRAIKTSVLNGMSAVTTYKTSALT